MFYYMCIHHHDQPLHSFPIKVPVEDQDSTEGAEKDDEPEAVNGGVEAANNSGEVVDQIVQTEAGGEEVSRIANLQEGEATFDRSIVV